MGLFTRAGTPPAFEHRCYQPRESGSEPWTCDVCGREWEPMDDGRNGWQSSGQDYGQIVAVTMRYADGTERTFTA